MQVTMREQKLEFERIRQYDGEQDRINNERNERIRMQEREHDRLNDERLLIEMEKRLLYEDRRRK